MRENQPLEADARRTLSWQELQDVDDLDLIRQLARGNDDALAVIVDRYQRLVLTIALRIVKHVSEAEDVVQNVFLDIFRKAGQFDPSRGTLKVWLLQYAYTRSINRRHYLEQRQFYSALEIEEAGLLAPATQPANAKQLVPLETVQLVRESLGMLNERQHVAIDLIYFEGLTLAEAAQKTGESLPALRHNYYRGLMKLRELINSTRESAAAESQAAPETIRLEVANLKARTI